MRPAAGSAMRAAIHGPREGGMDDEAMAANRRRWDEMVAINMASELYAVDAFRRGETAGQRAFEWDDLGPVAGLEVLHLQCHFGLDSLALARAGARVTGLDFSAEAIRRARALAAELGLEARFVEGNVYDAPALIEARFDLVYVTWGTICWLPDILRWAKIVAGFLRPGGRFYFADGHPFALSFEEAGAADPLRLREPYFHRPEPRAYDDDRAYADASARLANRRTYEWVHGLGEVVSALLAAGLRLRWLREQEFCVWRMFPCMTEGKDGLWRLPPNRLRIPLSYALLALRAAG